MIPINSSSRIEERRAIAEELALLSPGIELNDNPKQYFSLDVGTRPNKNAVIIPKFANHVSFYIEDPSLIEKLKNAGFEVKAFPQNPKRLYNKSKHKVLPMTSSDIAEHKALINEVLTHSLNVINGRRAKK